MNFYHEELDKLQQKKKNTKTRDKWPENAKLIHLDGTQCSEACMKTSRYHMEPADLPSVPTTLSINNDPRNKRNIGINSTETNQDHNDDDSVSVSNTMTIAMENGTDPLKTGEQLSVQVNTELECATDKDKDESLKELPSHGV